MTERRRTDPLPLGGDDGPPYSKGLMARALMAVGVPGERAYELARAVELDLEASGEQAVTLERVHELAVGLLGADEGGFAVERLRRLRELASLDLPIVILVGGGTGTGKSTVATEVAHRLGITRVTSTDFVRQTMRAFFSTEFMPSIHHSSFEARVSTTGDDASGEQTLPGFLDQTRNVLVGVRAAIDRALQEGWSMVLEGVHLVPGMLPPIDGALVVQCVLTIDDEEEHRSHFWTRDASSDGLRPLDKYLERFDDIRALQMYIVERARRTGVPVIENTNVDASVDALMELVLAGAKRLETVA